MVERIDFRAFDPAPAGEGALENERRFRAAVEAAMGRIDRALGQVRVTGGGSPNLDGGGAGSVYGGIDTIDGGSV